MTRRTGVLVALLIAATLSLLYIMRTEGPAGPAFVATPTPTASATATEERTATASATATASPSPPAAAPVGAKPDARYGLIVPTGNMRTETDPRGLQDPSLFMTNSAYAVSPDGKRIALIRTSQTGQHIVTFTTGRPNDLTTVVDLAGSGELASRVVWAGDGSDSLLFDAVRERRGSGGGDNLIWEYSALRSVDLASREVREVARIAGQNTKLWQLGWLPARQLVGAVEMRQLGPVANYVVIRSGAIERTAMNPSPGVASFGASRDGARIVVSLETTVRWWPTDQPTAAKELTAQGAERIGHVEFRPGRDELGVDVDSAFEIWSLTGQRRVVAERTPGFLRWRVDGSAAIASSDPSSVWLVDPTTGAKTQLPGGGFPVSDVVMFDVPQ